MRRYPQRVAQSGLRRSHEGGKGSAALKSWTQLNLCKSFGTLVLCSGLLADHPVVSGVPLHEITSSLLKASHRGPDLYHTATDTFRYNPYVAMPSLRIALPTIVCLGLTRHANKFAKLLVIGYLGLMLAAIVVTGKPLLL